MEELLSINTFHSFSLENYYFTDQSIVVATVNYLKSLNKDCEFLGIDLGENPIISINNFNYKLKYNTNLIGLASFDSISLERINTDILLDLNSELAKIILENLNNHYD